MPVRTGRVGYQTGKLVTTALRPEFPLIYGLNGGFSPVRLHTHESLPEVGG